MIFDNSLEPISCTLISIDRELISEYHPGDRYGFPSYTTSGQYTGGDLVVILSHQSRCHDRLRLFNSLYNHFILTNDHEQTHLLNCIITQCETTQSIFDRIYKIHFHVINVGKRSLPIPDWEISSCYEPPYVTSSGYHPY